MNVPRFSSNVPVRLVLKIIIAALLTACGGPEPPIAAPGAMPQSRAIATQAQRGGSWMLLEASGEDLLYVTKGCSGTCVLSYPSGQLVGSLDTGHYYGAADCVDSQGDVFISNDTNIVEYAHGGTSPVATLSLPGDQARGCSVDPVTGNLAVAFEGQGYDIAIFPQAQGTPALYLSGAEASYCGYDNVGDLFVDGQTPYSQPALAELPNSASAFLELSITYKVGSAGQVQWDGSNMTWESTDKHDSKLSRLSITGSIATVVGTTMLKGIKNRAAVSWLYANSVIVPYATDGPNAKKVGVWNYPNGGKHIASFKKFGGKEAILQAVTLSPAPSHLGLGTRKRR